MRTLTKSRAYELLFKIAKKQNLDILRIKKPSIITIL